MNETLCWNCGHPYPMNVPRCPVCSSVNANVDFGRAMSQVSNTRKRDRRFADDPNFKQLFQLPDDRRKSERRS